MQRRIPLSYLALADGAFAPETWVGNGVPTLPWNHVVSLQSRLSVFRCRDDHAPFFLSMRHGGSARGLGSWSFLNLKLLLGVCGLDVAVVANAWRDDGDGLRRRGVDGEECGVDGAIVPAGAETLGEGSIGGPTV